MSQFGQDLETLNLMALRLFFKTSLKRFTLLLVAGLSLGFAEGDRYLDLAGGFNARSEANFSSSSNVQFVLPAGTRAEILQSQKFSGSGNYGLRIKVASGPFQGRETWIYYNARNPRATPMNLYKERPQNWTQETAPSRTTEPESAAAVVPAAPTPARPEAPLPLPPDWIEEELPLPPPEAPPAPPLVEPSRHRPSAAGSRGQTEGTSGAPCTSGHCAQRPGIHVQTAREVQQAVQSADRGLYVNPMPGRGIYSGFGDLRQTGRRPRAVRSHAGADFSAPAGTPVMAARAGVVTKVINHCPMRGPRSNPLCGNQFGNHILIRHADGAHTVYAHLSPSCAARIVTNQTVNQGQQIGCVGNSGRTHGRTGLHLHFEIRLPQGRRSSGDRAFFPGYAVDPGPFLRSSSGRAQ